MKKKDLVLKLFYNFFLVMRAYLKTIEKIIFFITISLLNKKL